ncbi:MAG: hypothetical protein QM730_14090 [Anaerolineales bacterium]
MVRSCGNSHATSPILEKIRPRANVTEQVIPLPAKSIDGML